MTLMAKITQDLYTQRLCVTVDVQAAGGALTVYAFTDAYKPEDTTGFIIQEVRYHIEDGLIQHLNTTLDRVKFGLSFLQAFPAGGPEANDPGILDHHSITRYDLAAPAADLVVFEHSPVVVRHFTSLKGGGLLVHPVNLFAFAYADAAIAAAIDMHVEITFIRINLTDALHKELFQSIYIRQV